jgi:hypothetical protein
VDKEVVEHDEGGKDMEGVDEWRVRRRKKGAAVEYWGVRALQSASAEHWVVRLRSATNLYDVERERADSTFSACE